MPNLKDIKNRISSVKATQKITKAMQMVAAAKLRRAQEKAEAARPYATRMDVVLQQVTRRIDDMSNAPQLLAGNGNDKVHLLLVCTGDRGLCGGFNSSIVRHAYSYGKQLIDEGKEIKVLCVGRKGYEVLRRRFSAYMLEPFLFENIKQIDYDDAAAIYDRVNGLFVNNEFDVCSLFFARFESVISQKPTHRQLIPLDVRGDSEKINDNRNNKDSEDGGSGKNTTGTGRAGASEKEQGLTGDDSPFEYEPESAEVLAELLPRNITVQIFRALLENAASEQGARMSAMDNATRNAGDLIDNLTLTYNRTRQAMITKELIEIISGAEAV